jgi:hypothetical protein
VVQQDTVTDLGEDDDSVAALDADLAMGGGAAAPVQPLPPTLEQVVSRWLTVLGVLVLVLLVALVFLVRHVQRRRREQIMRELEKKTGVMKVPRRPPTTVIRARSGTGATPVQTRTPLPPPGTVMPPPTDRPPSPPRTPPPTRTPSPSAPPPTAGDAGVPEEVYQRIRKQVYEDLREEVMQEMANERRKMFARAEVFTRTVETYVNDLTKHIAETETSWNDLSASIKNTAFRLKQALEGFEQQHNGS